MFHGFLLPRGPRSSPQAPAVRAARPPRRAGSQAHPFTVRLAEPADQSVLLHLAALDSSRMPAGPLLVGEMGGGIQAAVPVMGGRAIANPFVRTAELVSVLELRAQQMRAERAREPELGRVIALPRATLGRMA